MDHTKLDPNQRMDKRAPARRKHFTEVNVLTLKPDRLKQYLIWDQGTGAARGLGILVSPTGTKSYRCSYYFPGSAKAHFRNLGRVGELSLDQARALCHTTRAMARSGEDPKSDSPTRSDNFKAAVENYIQLEQVGKQVNRSAGETRNLMLNHCRGWLGRPIATIRSGEIQNLLQLIRDGDGEKGLKPRPYVANRLYSHLKTLFTWCASSGSIKVSPMINMSKPWNGAKPRDRAWFKKTAADDAIRSLWRCADDIGGDQGRYLKLMILTGKRKTALSHMLWEEIDETWFWDAPPSEAKNKRLNGVPLPRLAQRALNPRQNQGPVFGGVNLDALQAKIRTASGITDFFWHGVRHLAETKTAELRDAQGRSVIPPHIRDLLFDHAIKRGSGAGYDHHDYKLEMADAMEAWSMYVEGLVQRQSIAA
jgi:integrase